MRRNDAPRNLHFFCGHSNKKGVRGMGVSRLTASALMLFFFMMLPQHAQSKYECGGVQDTCECGTNNFCICCSDSSHGTDHGNCVWYAWHKACCVWGIGLEWCTNANTWDGYATNNGYPVNTTACTNTVFVCEAYTTLCGAGSVGHVGWVNHVYPNGSIDVEEQGCYAWYGVQTRNFAAQNASPTMNYIYKPSTGGSCGSSCECTAGQTQTEGCENCGTRSRTCGSDCRWGSWSSCTGQGVCSPGQTEYGGSCGNCGTEQRTCSNSCSWGSWTCSGEGVCSPGQTQTEGCENCGARSRTCGSNCQWGSWSSCTGQGVCSPGQTQTADCCDCGTESRTCGNDCYWNEWSECSGPDPEGAPECDTGEPGPCAEGRMRCINGCLECARIVDPVPEICDGVDNDCNGLIDNGYPLVMGDPPPEFAARLVDWSAPARIKPGERIQVWAVFENVGLATWPAGEVHLAASGPHEGEPSLFYDPQSWSAHDTAAVLRADMTPGEWGEFVFDVTLSKEVVGEVTERFILMGPDYEFIRCPKPFFDISSTTSHLEKQEDKTSEPRLKEKHNVVGGCSCIMAGSDSAGTVQPIAFLLQILIPLLLLLGFIFRKRRVSDLHARKGLNGT